MWNRLYRTSIFAGIRFPDGHNYEDVMTTWHLMKKLAENGGTVADMPQAFLVCQAHLHRFQVEKSTLYASLLLSRQAPLRNEAQSEHHV